MGPRQGVDEALRIITSHLPPGAGAGIHKDGRVTRKIYKEYSSFFFENAVDRPSYVPCVHACTCGVYNTYVERISDLGLGVKTAQSVWR